MLAPTGALERINALLEAVLAGNEFYRRKLYAAGVRGTVSSVGEFTARARFTVKAELVEDQAAHPPYGTNLTYPIERYSRFNQTSGTSGAPMRWLDTRDSSNWMLDCWTRVYQAAGVIPEDRIFFPFSFGPFLGFWVAFEAATRMGCLSIPGGGMRSAARLRSYEHVHRALRKLRKSVFRGGQCHFGRHVKLRNGQRRNDVRCGRLICCWRCLARSQQRQPADPRQPLQRVR